MEKKAFTLRLSIEALERLDELSSKHSVSKQNLLNMMVAQFDDSEPSVVNQLAEFKYAKYKTPARRQVDKLASLIGNKELSDGEREELRRIMLNISTFITP